MNITLGVYDLFAYAVPGSLYLTLTVYIADRLAWIDPARILHANTTIVIIAGAILSYVVGHITYGVGYVLSRAYGHDKTIADARNEFVERVPTAQGRPFLEAHRSVLFSAVETHATEAAAEIARLRAVGLMLRNSAPVFVLGAFAAIADAAANHHPVIAGCCIVVFLLSALGCLSQSVVMRHWANMRTLESAYWVPNIDSILDAGNSTTKRAPRARSSPSSASQSPSALQ
jgi:hypothetical protein